MAEKKVDHQTLSWQEVSAAAALLGLYVYGVGVYALVLSIHSFTGGLDTAWYAISLVPRNFVIGQIAQLALTKLVPVLIVGTAYLLCALLMGRLFLVRGDHWSTQVKASIRYLMLGAVVAFATVLISLFPGLGSVFSLFGYGFSLFSLFGYGFSLLCMLAGLAVFAYLVRGAIPDLVQRAILDRSRITQAYVAFFVVAYIGIIAPAITDPEIAFTRVRVDVDSKKQIDGLLLAHTDTYWYILLYMGPVDLVAIPDHRVDEVQMPLQQEETAQSPRPARRA